MKIQPTNIFRSQENSLFSEIENSIFPKSNIWGVFYFTRFNYANCLLYYEIRKEDAKREIVLILANTRKNLRILSYIKMIAFVDRLRRESHEIFRIFFPARSDCCECQGGEREKHVKKYVIKIQRRGWDASRARAGKSGRGDEKITGIDGGRDRIEWLTGWRKTSVRKRIKKPRTMFRKGERRRKKMCDQRSCACRKKASAARANDDKLRARERERGRSLREVHADERSSG